MEKNPKLDLKSIKEIFSGNKEKKQFFIPTY